MEPLPLTVVHYSKHDPRTTVGGVETFARSLCRIFADVRFVTPHAGDKHGVMRERLPVVCDNQRVLDWPDDYPVIGFQHGVGAVKRAATGSLSHWWLARRQAQAAVRANTLWVACAEWVGLAFGRLYGNSAQHVIHYPVDIDRFDGRLDNAGSRVILHDARTRHKGAALIPELQRAFPAWRFEPLACDPALVPERMRRARAFVHLSRYEGNSLVCNEAMAMNLPCLFTRVGLLRDSNRPTEIYDVDAEEMYTSPARLIEEAGRFIETLETRAYRPREWVVRNATLEIARDSWQRVMLDYRELGPAASGPVETTIS